MEKLKIFGKYIIRKNGVLVGETSNVVTKAAKDAILRAIAQVSGGGDEIGSSFYIHHLAVGLFDTPLVPPDTWYTSNLTALGDVHGDSEISTPPVAIDDSLANLVQVVFETSWTNSSEISKNVDMFAAIYDTADYTADNVLSVSKYGTPITVANGEELEMTYILGFQYN